MLLSSRLICMSHHIIFWLGTVPIYAQKINVCLFSRHVKEFLRYYDQHISKIIVYLKTNTLVILRASTEPCVVTAKFYFSFCHIVQGTIDLFFNTYRTTNMSRLLGKEKKQLRLFPLTTTKCTSQSHYRSCDRRIFSLL